MAVLCAVATVPAGVEAHGGIYHYAERSIPGGLAVIALVIGLIVGLALLSTAVTTASGRRSSRRRLLAATAGVAIMAIPVSNASVNPARSLATAVVALGEPMAQLWLFWVAPILGGLAGGLLGRWFYDE